MFSVLKSPTSHGFHELFPRLYLQEATYRGVLSYREMIKGMAWQSGEIINRTLSKPKTCLNQTDFTVLSTKCLCNLNLCKPNTCLNQTDFTVPSTKCLCNLNLCGTVKSVWFRQVFGLRRFKLHRHLVDGTVKSVWFRQVFGLVTVWFRQCLNWTNSSVPKGLGW
jgi:hypothetical protein